MKSEINIALNSQLAVRLRYRVISTFLLLPLLLTSSPLALPMIAAERAAEGQPKPPVVQKSTAPIGPSAEAQIIAPTPDVTPNRKVPEVAPMVLSPRFSAKPSGKEITSSHVLPHSLVPDEGASPEKNARVARFLEEFGKPDGKTEKPEDAIRLARFVEANPNSGWDASLYANLGHLYYRGGHFSKALTAWEKAWEIGKQATEPKLKSVVDEAVGQLARMHARVGHFERLESLMAELKGRPVIGSTTELLTGAAEGLFIMKYEPERAFLCGPMAVGTLSRVLNPNLPRDPRIHTAKSTQQGTSLTQVAALAKEIGLNYQMAKRHPGAPVIVPSIVNWKVGHFAALTKRTEDRTLIEDPTFGDRIWIRDHTLDAETSGYFIVPAGALPEGWESVDKSEGDLVWGKGNTGSTDPDATKEDEECTSCGCGKGMAVYQAQLAVVSLNIKDIPLFYSPPKGPPVQFKVTYSQRDANQPGLFYYSNLGPKWTCDWISFIIDDPDNPETDARIYLRGGGVETYSGYSATTGSYSAGLYSQAVLVRTSAGSYERRMSDGSKEIFDVTDGSSTTTRRVFLRQVVDPAGNTMTFTFDNTYRIVAVTDALGQVTTISYDLADDPLKVTKVTDPFGRFATFEYQGGLLTKITDVIGISSEFNYSGDFINTLTTPYGASHFAYGDVSTEPDRFGWHPALARTRWLEMSDAMGGKERVEFNEITGLGIPEALDDIPSGLHVRRSFLFARNTYYWDKKAMMEMDGDLDYSKAHIYHWVHFDGTSKSGSIIESEKPALQARKFYNYPGQPPGDEGATYTGSMNRPSAAGILLSTGVTLLKTKEYNPLGHMTKSVDAMGRETTYTYHANLVDLLEVRNTTGGLNELIASYTYNAQHLPLTIKDAAGQVNTRTYNTSGQLLSSAIVRGSINETANLIYDANGYLQIASRPMAGATTSFSYDAFGRIRTMTNSEGYTITYDYDNLNRVIKTSFPDGTYTQTIFKMLDPEWLRDRLGRWTHQFHDRLGRLVRVDDPSGRRTTYDWCLCGTLHGVTDGEGRTTRFAYDLEKRVIQKTFDDGTAIQFSYDSERGLLKRRVDAQGIATTYSYNLDDTLAGIDYAGGSVSTPSVSYTYDPQRHRVTAMNDGSGTTAYVYHPIAPGNLGAGRLAAINGPFDNDTITFDYDELGRRISRGVNGVQEATTFDELGRVVSTANALGDFEIRYLNATNQVSRVEYPNGQLVEHTYYPNVGGPEVGNGDRRLAAIINRLPSGSIISRFEYGYNAIGEITRWQESGNLRLSREFDLYYNPSGELTGSTSRSSSNGNIEGHIDFTYDKAGNRIVEQIDNAATKWSYNNVNQVIGRNGTGPLVIEGKVDEASTVTVGGRPAHVDGNLRFRATIDAVPGNQNVEIRAVDASGNATTKQASIPIAAGASSQTFVNDVSGNLINNGVMSFEWDGENRLAAINYLGTSPLERTEFVYNGLSQRTKILEKVGGVVVTEKRFIWDAGESFPLEERNNNNVVTGRFFAYGEETGGEKLYYTKDHLGSIRELTDAAGLVRACYNYDLYGRRHDNLVTTQVRETRRSFTGHYQHDKSGKILTLHRVYDPSLGRWMSRDPIGEVDGVNLYTYAGNNSVVYRDEYGLKKVVTGVETCSRPGPHWYLKIDGVGYGFYPNGGDISDIIGVSRGAISPNDTGGTCTPIILDDCKYNIYRFKQCVRGRVTGFVPVYNVLYNNCWMWMRTIISDCKDEAKK